MFNFTPTEPDIILVIQIKRTLEVVTVGTEMIDPASFYTDVCSSQPLRWLDPFIISVVASVISRLQANETNKSRKCSTVSSLVCKTFYAFQIYELMDVINQTLLTTPFCSAHSHSFSFGTLLSAKFVIYKNICQTVAHAHAHDWNILCSTDDTSTSLASLRQISQFELKGSP